MFNTEIDLSYHLLTVTPPTIILITDTPYNINNMCDFETNFLITVIKDFKKLLLSKDKSYYDNTNYQFVYNASSALTETGTLSKFSTMIYYYYRAYNEPYPIILNDSQREMADEVWRAMGMPEMVGNYTPT